MNEEFWNKRRLKIYARNEYGDQFNHICDLPIFFHNRPFARIEKIELIDQDENPIQTIEETKKKIDAHKEFYQIITTHELIKDMKI